MYTYPIVHGISFKSSQYISSNNIYEILVQPEKLIGVGKYISYNGLELIKLLNKQNICELTYRVLKYIYDNLMKLRETKLCEEFENLIVEFINTGGSNYKEILSFMYKNLKYLFSKIKSFDFVICFFKETPQNTNKVITLSNNYAHINKIKKFKTSPFAIYAYASYMAYQEQNINNPIINKFFEKYYITKKHNDTNVLKVLVTHRVKENNKIERYYIVAFKGTEPTNLKDLKADINIALKNQENDERFKFCTAYVKMFKSIPKYKNSRVVLTGHSLGGSIAIHVASNLNLPCVVFNPGSSICREMNYNSKMLVIHKCYEDPICAFAGFSGTTHIYKTGKSALSAHSLENFLQLNN